MSRRAVVRKVAVVGGAGLLFVGGIIQLVPYGWTKTNPPVTAEAPWPDAESEAVARESCYSCHSNETDWPAYSYVAPMSWLVRRDVDRGRAELNFSEWGEESDPDDAAEEVEDGDMPPSQYTMIHRGARLTDEEARVLVAALERMDDED
ncbi:MAG TPA: heme-binding domain-containing protein [Iamia sp.]